ncbi:hypothetical protein [Streptomyces sp. NPDC048641]|uniref:hypothetical protein n=1 Tax=Streptomyces sp. NPDC048641 TaxID=3154825 RepID=UPI00342527BE
MIRPGIYSAALVAVAAVIVVMAATQEQPAHTTRPVYACAPETGRFWSLPAPVLILLHHRTGS